MNTVASQDPQALQERLKDPNTVASLNRLLDHLDTIETIASQAPNFVAMAGDSIDGGIQKAQNAGININERLTTMGVMAEKLSRQETSDQLNSLIEIATQAPRILSIIADTVDGLMQRAQKSGIDVNEHVENALGIAMRLTDTKTSQHLNQLLNLSDEIPGFISMIVDSLDSYSRQAQLSGIDLNQSISNSLSAGLRLSAKLTPEYLKALEQLIDNLDENSFELVSNASQALQTAQHARSPMTHFGLISKLNDPDVKKALGFLTTFAQQFGKNL